MSNSNVDINEQSISIEDISHASKSLFKNSFKRKNTKTWNLQTVREETKNSELYETNENKDLSDNILTNNFINLNSEKTNKIEKENFSSYDVKKIDKEYINTINKFNSLNFISSQSTNDMYDTDRIERVNQINTNATNFSYNKFEYNEEQEIEDETITKNNFINAEEEISNVNIKKNASQDNDKSQNLNSIEISKSGLQDVDVIKSSNGILKDMNQGNLNAGDYIYDESIKIIKYISEGAQAKVYLGLIEEIDKYVAIKRYTLFEADDNLIDKITAECENVKKLEHPNIVRYFDVEINYYNNLVIVDLIMEHVKGFSLKEYILAKKDKVHPSEPVDINKIKFIIKNLLEGITYLHNNKIIHRDLKPENILITDDFENIKIVDFGISTKVKDSETYKSRSLLGTPWYMAPEVILEKPYAFEADIWSIGCILYELISGVRPYNDDNPFNAMLKMAQYTSPLEYADEDTKDIFYDKSNRNLLDFLQKTWRANNIFRPSANELIEHQFLN